MGFSDNLVIFIFMFISYYSDRIITAQAQEPEPYYLAWSVCTGSNFTANGPYKTNLNLLLSSLSTTFTNNNTVPRYGYRNITIGDNPDTVYGSLHCREDISPEICSKCVQIAADEVVKDTDDGCPNSKGAIMFYNGCVLRYSDKYYFSRKDQAPETGMRTMADFENPDQFLNLTLGLLNGLVVKAVNDSSSGPSLYATGSTNYSSTNQVYAMVQCTPDITPTLCEACLRKAIGTLYCCTEAKGARVLTPSCTFRFEVYTFYGKSLYATESQALAPAPLLLPPSIPRSPSNTTN
ncbi:hypothetical protein MKX03_017436, partial [Papaver bracteatum]